MRFPALITSISLAIVSAAGAEPLPIRDAAALAAHVERAAALVRARGESAFADFRRKGSLWLHDDSYVTVYDLLGVTLCQPVNRAMEGRMNRDLKDPDGRLIVRNMLDAVAGGRRRGWLLFRWPRPPSNHIEPKATYFAATRGPSGKRYVVGSGAYNLKVSRPIVMDWVQRAVLLIQARGEEAFPILRDPLGPFRYQDLYLFIVDGRGNTLLHAGFPEQEGRNMMNLKDPRGKLFVRDFLRIIRTRGAGWTDYMWPRPGSRVAARKFSYVHRAMLDGKMVCVGAGVYLDASGKR